MSICMKCKYFDGVTGCNLMFREVLKLGEYCKYFDDKSNEVDRRLFIVKENPFLCDLNCDEDYMDANCCSYCGTDFSYKDKGCFFCPDRQKTLSRDQKKE